MNSTTPIKLRIMIYSDLDPERGGGQGAFSLDLLHGFLRMGYDAFILSSMESTRKLSESVSECPFRVARRPLVVLNMNFNFVGFLLDVKKSKPNIVFFNAPSFMENVAIPVLRVLGYKTVVMYHQDFHIRFAKTIHALLKRLILPITNLLLVQSQSLAQSMLEFGVDKSKIEVIPSSGIDLDEYNCTSDRTQPQDQNMIKLIFIGYLDRNHKYKGVEELLRIFRAISDTNPTAETFALEIIGSGDLEEFYRKVAQSLKLPNVTFMGYLSKESLIYELCESDALILPSISKSEGFGRVVLEAIACKKPVIVSKFAGVAEYVAKWNVGLVINPHKIEESAISIVNLFQDRETRREMIANEAKVLSSGEISSGKIIERISDRLTDLLT